MYYLPPDTADRVRISRLPGATFDNVQDWLNNIQSSGRISGGEITDNGDGSVTVAAGTGFIKIGDSEIALTQSFDWAEDNSVALTDNTANYIYIDYNAGSPQILVTTDRTSIRTTDQFTIGRVYRVGITLHIINSGIRLYNQVRQEHERLLEVRGFERASGGIISETGLRYLFSTAGVFYLGHNRFTTTGQDTSAADRFTAYYYDGAVWVPVPNQTQISNTQYNDITLGVLANVAIARYGVHWIYIDYDGHLFSVYGQDSYKLADAENATVPGSIPLILSAFAILAAKIIIKRNDPNFTSCVSAYVTLFPVSTPPDHNDLGGVQGGAADDYYHLTAAILAALLAHPGLTTGVHGVGAGAVVGTALAQTLTNKTLISTTNVVEYITSLVSTSTPIPIGAYLRNFFILTALAVDAYFAEPVGPPVNANKLIIRIKDNGTARALSWAAIYRAMEFALPATTVISKTLYLGFIYNSADSKWDMVAINQEA